ncbi:sulfurtransferase [Roseomonas sp. CCTCC AB2023176]|uniref:sulfurtransferase n=1 Tax=Roseomonas sp. CCTCC AB2023176 TaxID=3342640 RepID=UPI0035D70913
MTTDEARLRAQVLITAQDLAAERDDPRLVVLAVGNAEYGMPPGPPFIPGAVPVDMPTDFAGRPGGTRGSRPLPEIGDLQAKARSWGLREDTRVVLYDDDRLLQAARGWWTLRWAGMTEVRLLDGGFRAWRAARLPTADSRREPETGDVCLSPGHMPTLDADGAAAWARDRLLLDTRVKVNYIGGRTAPGELRRGHIPGTISSPAHDALTEAGPFADPATLRLLFDSRRPPRARRDDLRCRRFRRAYRRRPRDPWHRGADVRRVLVRLGRRPRAPRRHRRQAARLTGTTPSNAGGSRQLPAAAAGPRAAGVPPPPLPRYA